MYFFSVLLCTPDLLTLPGELSIPDLLGIITHLNIEAIKGPSYPILDPIVLSLPAAAPYVPPCHSLSPIFLFLEYKIYLNTLLPFNVDRCISEEGLTDLEKSIITLTRDLRRKPNFPISLISDINTMSASVEQSHLAYIAFTKTEKG